MTWHPCRNPRWTCRDPAHRAAGWTGQDAWNNCPSRDQHWRQRHGMCGGDYGMDIGGGEIRCLCCGFTYRISPSAHPGDGTT